MVFGRAKTSSTVVLSNRREFLVAGGISLICATRKAPALIIKDHARPQITHGVASGDPSVDGVVIWSRTDRPSRMRVEWSYDPSFKQKHVVLGDETRPERDYTARASIVGASPGKNIFYRVYFDDQTTRTSSAPTLGQLRIPDTMFQRPYRFVWSGDLCGQGYGINPDIGGYTIFEAMARLHPDVFLHCGDMIYADARLVRQRRLDSGQIWRNLMTPSKSKVAETLAEFHGNYRYNLMDDNLRRFNAQVPSIGVWDDHETKNNWWPGWSLRDPRYTLRNGQVLAQRARQAFFDYVPMARKQSTAGRIYRQLPQGPLADVFTLDGRTFRASNEPDPKRGRQVSLPFFGVEQIRWLVRQLTASQALWKVIVCPQPLSTLIYHTKGGHDGIGNGRPGPPKSRELELAHLLKAMKENRIKNCVWVTADVHYAAAHRYEPDRAATPDFDGFWEFIAGPLNAGTFGPNQLDPTFGPKVEFISLPKTMRQGASPLDGLQFFGSGSVDNYTGILTVSLHDMKGRVLWSKAIEPHLG